MSATYSSIQTRVRNRLIDMPTTVSSEVPQLVLDAYKELQERHNFKVMDAELAANTTVGNRVLVAIPSDFKEWRGRPYRLDDQGVQWPLDWSPDRQSLNGAFGEEDVGFPQILYIDTEGTTGAGDIQVWPLPDGNADWDDGEYRVRMPYRKFLADPSADGDTNWLINNGDRYLIAHAVAAGFAMNWDEQRAQIWMAAAEAALKKLVIRDKTFRLSGFDTLIPQRDVNGPHLGT